VKEVEHDMVSRSLKKQENTMVTKRHMGKVVGLNIGTLRDGVPVLVVTGELDDRREVACFYRPAANEAAYKLACRVADIAADAAKKGEKIEFVERTQRVRRNDLGQYVPAPDDWSVGLPHNVLAPEELANQLQTIAAVLGLAPEEAPSTQL